MNAESIIEKILTLTEEELKEVIRLLHEAQTPGD